MTVFPPRRGMDATAAAGIYLERDCQRRELTLNCIGEAGIEPLVKFARVFDAVDGGNEKSTRFPGTSGQRGCDVSREPGACFRRVLAKCKRE